MKKCDEGEPRHRFKRFGVVCDSCNKIHKGRENCGGRSGICKCCGRNVHYVRPANNEAYWRHNGSRANIGTDKGNEDDHTRAIDKLLELTSKGTPIRIDYSRCPGIQSNPNCPGIPSNPNCEGLKEPFTIHRHEYKFKKEVTLVRQDSYGEKEKIKVDLFGTKDEKNPTKSNSLIIEVRHTHEQCRNEGIPWHEVSATEVNSARVEEGVLTLKAVNVCSSCRLHERSRVMEERIDKVLKRMGG